jgi:hypothetical protein
MLQAHYEELKYSTESNNSYPKTVEDVVESDCGISGTDVQRKFKRMKIAEEQGTGRCFLVVVQNWITSRNHSVRSN